MINYLLLFIATLVVLGCGGESGSSTGTTASSTTTGVSGSMARFAISGDYLYTIKGEQMDIFDLSDASNPQSASKVHLPFNVETIFAYKDYLYIGASTGVYIYDKSIPTQPTKIAELSHAQSCDPIVIDDDIAYITLNSSSSCSIYGDVNSLMIVDMQDPTTPAFIKSVDMWAPTGLGVDDGKLFICDGDSGLKIFDINKIDNGTSIDVNISNIGYNNEIDCYDLIAHQNNLIISNKGEIRQYDYSSFPMYELGQIK